MNSKREQIITYIESKHIDVIFGKYFDDRYIITSDDTYCIINLNNEVVISDTILSDDKFVYKISEIIRISTIRDILK